MTLDHLFLFWELLGTVAFAASGAMTGLEKKMDLFGVCTLGLTTAVGGGIIRDVVLGNTPPMTFRDPSYAMVALATALVLFFSHVRRYLKQNQRHYDLALFWMDTLGLGIFTVSGVRLAYSFVYRPSVFLLVFVGVITGVGGGVLRDIMAGNTPYIFVKHVYACASLVGALVCSVLWYHTDQIFALLAGACTVFLIRVLARHYRWNLPYPHD